MREPDGGEDEQCVCNDCGKFHQRAWIKTRGECAGDHSEWPEDPEVSRKVIKEVAARVYPPWTVGAEVDSPAPKRTEIRRESRVCGEKGVCDDESQRDRAGNDERDARAGWPAVR